MKTAIVLALKPCPFCGSESVKLWRGQIVGHSRDNGHRFARCTDCGASGPYKPALEAAEHWNSRAPQTQLGTPARTIPGDD